MTNKDKPDVPTPNGPSTVDLDVWPGVEISWDNIAATTVATTPVLMGYQNIKQDININGSPALEVTGSFILRDEDDKNPIDVGETLRAISERLSVLQPDLEAHENYPALKDAYEKYKMLEKLLLSGDKNDKQD